MTVLATYIAQVRGIVRRTLVSQYIGVVNTHKRCHFFMINLGLLRFSIADLIEFISVHFLKFHLVQTSSLYERRTITV